MSGATTVPWIGRVEFELWSRRGWRVGVAEIVVRRDVVEISARRPLGTFHRGELTAWLRRRHDRPLAADDVVWEIVRGLVAVRLAGSGPAAVPPLATRRRSRARPIPRPLPWRRTATRQTALDPSSAHLPARAPRLPTDGGRRGGGHSMRSPVNLRGLAADR
jgi:hypothetical protein